MFDKVQAMPVYTAYWNFLRGARMQAPWRGWSFSSWPKARAQTHHGEVGDSLLTKHTHLSSPALEDLSCFLLFLPSLRVDGERSILCFFIFLLCGVVHPKTLGAPSEKKTDRENAQSRAGNHSLTNVISKLIMQPASTSFVRLDSFGSSVDEIFRKICCWQRLEVYKGK